MGNSCLSHSDSGASTETLFLCWELIVLEHLTSESHVPSKRWDVKTIGCDTMIKLCQGTLWGVKAAEANIQETGEVENEGKTFSS